MRSVMILCVLCCSVLTSIRTQTYFSIGLGWDNVKMERGNSFEIREGALYLTEEQSNSSNYVVQGTIERQLSSSDFLALTGMYMARKEAAANWFAVIAPADQICFNVWGIRALYRKNVFEYFYIGSGIGTSFYSIKARLKSGSKLDVSATHPNNISYDLPVVLGYQYKRVLIEGYYQFGLGYQKDYSELVEPFKSIGVTINYLFKISDGNQVDKRF